MAEVVITGMGAISAAGIGIEAFEEAVLAGVPGDRDLVGPRLEGLSVRRAAQVQNYDAAAFFDRRTLAGLDLFSQYALIAAGEAVELSGIAEMVLAGPDTAVIIGTGIGGVSTLDEGSHAVYALGSNRVDVQSVPRVMPSAAGSQISMRYKTNGPSFAVSSACSSSTQAIGLGLMLLRAGVVRRAIVGGSEACIAFSVMKAWEALRVMTPTKCRPFSLDRNGMMLGEGAAVFVLELEEDARSRGAKVLARLCGYGTTSDGKDILRPDQAGCAGAMQAALDDAGISPDQIGYINAHGTGTIANDATESAAIAAVFGEYGSKVPVSSTKPIHGHALGAAGALELAASVIALRNQTLLPNANFLAADPACPVNLVHNTVATDIEYVLSNSFAFGGINSALVVGRANG
jgi:nodulation protein E